jgi:hypothetical protein
VIIMTTLKYRRTPWDQEEVAQPYPSLPPHLEAATAADQERTGRHGGLFCLHGLYVYDPDRSTSTDFRQFLWDGLHVLRTEALAHGLSEDEVHRLVVSAFDVFHDTADGLWAALRNIVSKVNAQTSTRPEPALEPSQAPRINDSAPPADAVAPNASLSLATPLTAESPEQADLRRLRLLLEEQEAYNRECRDEEMRELLED